MNQNKLLRLVMEDQIKGLPQDQQDKINSLATQILDIATHSSEGGIALALASVRYAESNE